MKQHPALCMLLLLALFLAMQPLTLASPADNLFEMTVKGVTLDPYGNTPIVVLEDTQGHRAFPIWIGIPEARAIIQALEGTSAPRPTTHALLQNILQDLQVKISQIIIHDLQSNTFFASISLQRGPTTLTIDARPSDAIALALAVQAPIFATQHVLKAVRTVNLSAPLIAEQTAKKFGMHLQNLNARLASALHVSNRNGVLVAFVEPDSLAARQGIQRGDLLTEADGKPIAALNTLIAFFKSKKSGETIVLQVWRNQESRTVHLQAGPTVE
jgi:bifunctional DNase/RNase